MIRNSGSCDAGNRKFPLLRSFELCHLAQTTVVLAVKIIKLTINQNLALKVHFGFKLNGFKLNSLNLVELNLDSMTLLAVKLRVQGWRFLSRSNQTISGPPESRNRLLHTKDRAFKCLPSLMWTGGVLQSIPGAFIMWCSTMDPLGLSTSKRKSTPMICTACSIPSMISSLLSIISSLGGLWYIVFRIYCVPYILLFLANNYSISYFYVKLCGPVLCAMHSYSMQGIYTFDQVKYDL